MESRSFRSGILFVLCLFMPLLIGFAGSIFTRDNIPGWFVTLQKPAFTPPDWVFAPVWTTLYILMGISLFLVLQKGLGDINVRRGVLLFAVQLVVNLLWSVVFFGMHSIVGGLLVIVVLLALVAATIYSFYGISKPAAWLLVPYIVWGCIATALNAMILVLN